jgi:glycerophosphoryl diester phosphodiesterase
VPASTRFAFLDWPGPIAFAHRGGAASGPENTMASFAQAVELGYRYLETDARVTSDGVLLAFHDESLDRVSDLTGRLEDRPWAEVQEARVGGEPIPTLEDLIAAFPTVRFNIDPKQDAVVEPLVEVLRRTAAHDRVCVAAFSDRRLLAVRRLTGGRVCTALGPAGIARLRAASYGVPVGPFAAACVQLPVRHRGRTLLDARLLRVAHRRHLPVHVWTIDEADEMGRLLDLGVDGIMTDRPEVLKEVLVSRGQWVQ